MTRHSGASLAAAVSAAGGLGSIAGLHPSIDPRWLRAETAIIRAKTDAPFAIGFITEFIPLAAPLFDAALAERPALIALSFGDPGPSIKQCKSAGVHVICQVQDYRGAELAVAAGADLLAAQGTEAGGHTGTMGLLPLLTGLVSRHPDVPVLAAGGIGDGRALAAALVAGAEGAWLGTAFLATPEATEVDDDYKNFILDSDGTDTSFTRAYDIVSPYPWPTNIGERVRQNRFTDEWIDREAELESRKAEVAQARAARSADTPEHPDTREVMYGQSAQGIDAIRPAAEVLRSVCEDAEAVLRTRPSSLLA